MKEITIVVIDDSMRADDPLIIKAKTLYEHVELLADPKIGLDYIKKSHQSKNMIVVCDYNFGWNYKTKGAWVLREIRRFSHTIPVIMFTSTGDQITQEHYKDLIRYKIFDLPDKGNYTEVLDVIKEAEKVYQKGEDVLALMAKMLNEKAKENSSRKKHIQSKHISFFVDKSPGSTSPNFKQWFSEIKVVDYKALQNVELKKLSQINIIAGLNNSGKTTLLEAVFLLCKQNEFDEFAEIQRMRGKFLRSSDVSLSYLRDSAPNRIEVQGVFESKKVSIKIKKEIQVKGIEAQGHVCSFFMDSSIEGDMIAGTMEENLNTTAHLYGENLLSDKTEIISGTQRNICLSEYYSPFAYQQRDKLQDAYSESVKTKSGEGESAHERIVTFIRKLDEDIQDIRLVIADESDVRFWVKHNKRGEARDITEFGDGLQRMYALAMQFATVQNGVLILDELENAIDYKRLSDFAGLIIELAVEFNVQVFLTSHSKECINAFFEYDALGRLSCYSLNHHQASYFSGYQYDNLIQVLDMDLRKKGEDGYE